MYCNKCFEEIPDGSTRCPYCGADLKTVSKGKKKSGGGLFGGAKKNKRSPGGQQVDETWNIMGNNSNYFIIFHHILNPYFPIYSFYNYWIIVFFFYKITY